MFVKGINIINISGKIKRKQYEYVFNEIMKKREGERMGILLIINSEGGSVTHTYAIYDLLKSSGIPITTVALGACMNMAALLFSLGTKRLVSNNALYMLNFATDKGDFENLSRVKSTFEMEKQRFFVEKIVKTIAQNSKCSEETIKKICCDFNADNNKFLGKEEVLKLGIATDVFDGDPRKFLPDVISTFLAGIRY